MTTELPSEVEVEIASEELGGQFRIGMLRRIGSGPGAIVSFAYDRDWIGTRQAFTIDPSHGLYQGDQFPAHGQIAGIFADTSPDRWGRTLLERRERLRAEADSRRPRPLGEWDFLLGVSDQLRMGGLRFLTAVRRYLDDDDDGVPPPARLRELEQASREFEDPSHRPRTGSAERLRLLLAPGASLGGARPKTTFSGEDGALWLAKFPSRSDRHDVGACEYLLNKLANRAGIDVPETKLLRLASDHRTFAARRFDRDGSDRRLYASAMTLTGKQDHDEASYLDVTLAIADHGAPAYIEADLEQLFRRVVFNVLSAHRDDHLRNHGFLRSREGWRLSPAFDLNPVPTLAEHQLAIDDSNRTPDLEVVLETASFYRLQSAAARVIADEVREAIASWREVAQVFELTRTDTDLLESALPA
jgi:serine/threonine-protein kinase HipA